MHLYVYIPVSELSVLKVNIYTKSPFSKPNAVTYYTRINTVDVSVQIYSLTENVRDLLDGRHFDVVERERHGCSS